MTSLHELIYADLVARFGKERAREYARANQAAVELVTELVARHRVECDLVRLPFTVFAESDATLRRVEAETQATQALGLPASFVGSVPLPVPCRGGVRLDRQAQFHPRRYLLALAATIPDGRSTVFEGARVTGIREGRPCTVTAGGGTVKARDVIIATVARVYFAGRISLPRKPAAAVPAGEAEVVLDGERRVAVYRDAEGQAHAVDPTCTHMGCLVVWNPAEGTWDCPCHGSRFTADGIAGSLMDIY